MLAKIIIGWVLVSAILTALWVIVSEVRRWRHHKRVQQHIRTVVAEMQVAQEERRRPRVA